ncbi:dipeptide ABC transporter ATP-binding protein [Neobacillus sp. CF12]|uniref:ABC transporter ATP-binding protein n=1 Tax=Neobacillus sp. CF12 TaxID=3055864 RepID=UPI0025A1A414|nr:dipeptide ABC transporter ATP-binding protein [Neobacillus sp. CF12]MDM5329876.1 dipeptide ABC transporter ATP-binding protein [Neobacillus sp. CF12]
MADDLLKIEEMKVHFPIKSGVFHNKINYVKAVDGISFSVKKGESFGIVGESGCGKSTASRAVLQLIKPTSGKVYFKDQELTSLPKRQLRNVRKNIQMVFQDPYDSLNPRLTVEEILEEPLKAHNIGSKEERRKKILEIMDVCGLNPEYIHRYAHEFSGGQRQRIGIARALILKPELVVADEPVSALDVSIQSQILNLMMDLQETLNLTYLFISHDLSVVRHFCDRIGVMYLGRMAELAESDSLFENPLHPYTKSLLSAIPISNPRQKRERVLLQGDVPSPVDPPKGCAFASRCPEAMNICRTDRPVMREVEKNHYVACHLYTEKLLTDDE